MTEALCFPSGELTLVGVLHRGSKLESRASNFELPRPGVVVCHPHPLYGGDMENNVVVALCRILAGGGLTALRFNFRGVGRSGGSFGDGLGEREDARAALDFLAGAEGVDDERLALAGYSFGALVALTTMDERARPSDRRVRAVVAVSLPAGGTDIGSVRQGAPTLLISGDRDNIAPAARLTEMAASLQLLPPKDEVRSVAGADHFWWGHEEALGAIVLEFLRARLLPGEP